MIEDKPGNQQMSVLEMLRAQMWDAGLRGADLESALNLMRDHARVNDETDRDRLCKLILVGNRLARGQATADEWHAAVAAVTPAPICVLSSED